MSAGFGDNVRIVDCPETRAKGIAGLVGSVYGETTPSVTGVEVIGATPDDFALKVHFEGTDDEIWIAPELVEFLDHGAGQTITFDGLDKEWVRTESGEWIERDLGGKKPT